jgi:DNA-binding NarL/FixJ family response regulator
MHSGFNKLTPRETVILEHLMKAHTIAEIADCYTVTKDTVRSQVKSILHKLEVRSMLAAVVLAYRSGWHLEATEADKKTS